jgi:hypothetical protein
MRPRAVLLYLFGREEAILAVAGARSSLWTGLILVLTAAIARNYDQVFVLERPVAFLEPILFSAGSAVFFFALIYFLFVRRRLDPQVAAPRALAQFRSFLGLFWMTAPIAWLYAIPVERFLGTRAAAELNIGLLAVVSLWRVLLLSRVFSVLQGVGFPIALGWVLLPACTEVLAFYIFGGPLSKNIMAGMAGLQNSPEEEILSGAMSFAFVGAIVVALFAALAPFASGGGSRRPFPGLKPGTFPVRCLALAFLGWVLVAIKPQAELQENHRLEELLGAGRYGDALSFLSRHERADFAPAKRIAPSPYAWKVFDQLPGLFRGKPRRYSRKCWTSFAAPAWPRRSTRFCGSFERRTRERKPRGGFAPS